MSVLALLTCAFPDHDTAVRIARMVVEERLAACANLTPCASVYRWEGGVEQADEVSAAFKTTLARAPDLAARIGDLHPYELPAIEWTPTHAPDAVAAWISASVS